MTRKEGTVTVRGTVAYAPQDPWYVISCGVRASDVWFLRIMSASVRENVLFSHEYDETFYKLVIEGKFILPVDIY